MSVTSTAQSVRLPLSLLRTDGGTQIRAQVDQRIVDDYAEKMAAPENTFPPVTAFDDGQDYWLADGFHRLAAAARAELADIACDLRSGSRRDAVLYAVGANSSHGLRRSNEDKRRAVRLLLDDDEWSTKSDRWIAERCGVSHTFVSDSRNQLATVASCPTGTTAESGEDDVRLGRDGKPRRARRKRRSARNASSVSSYVAPEAIGAASISTESIGAAGPTVPATAGNDSAPVSSAAAADADPEPKTDDPPAARLVAKYFAALAVLREARGGLHSLWQGMYDKVLTVDDIYYYELGVDDLMDRLWAPVRHLTDSAGRPIPIPSGRYRGPRL